MIQERKEKKKERTFWKLIDKTNILILNDLQIPMD